MLVAAHRPPGLPVGMNEVADRRIEAVLGRHADAELAEMSQIGIVTVAAPTALAVSGGKEIEIMDLELTCPVRHVEIFAMREMVERPPRCRGVARMLHQPAAVR